MALEIVKWRDAHFHLNEDEVEWDDQDDYLVETVGWVTEEIHGHTLWYRVEGEQTPENGRAITYIPAGMAVERTVLAASEGLTPRASK